MEAVTCAGSATFLPLLVSPFSCTLVLCYFLMKGIATRLLFAAEY